jgi:hypothetical protein
MEPGTMPRAHTAARWVVISIPELVTFLLLRQKIRYLLVQIYFCKKPS